MGDDDIPSASRSFRVAVDWFKETRYWREWLTAAIVYALAYAIGELVAPRDRYIPEVDGAKDPTLSYPKQASYVPDSLLFSIMAAGPPVFGLVGLSFGVSWIDLHHLCLSCVQSLATAALFKRTINVLVGRHRPNWYQLVEADPAHVNHGKLSYPSGHSAYSFACMTVLCLFLFGKLKVFHRSDLQLLHMLLAMLPVCLATFIAISRLMDYHHNFSDVNAGIFIGLSSAILAYHLNYPPVWFKTCGVPNSRIKASRSALNSDELTALRPSEDSNGNEMAPREVYQAI